MASISLTCQEVQPLAKSRARLVLTRLARMMAAWLILGALVGIGTGASAGGAAATMLANMLAGMILFPFVGALLGLIGGRARESLLGGVAGATFGAVLGAITSPAGPLETTTHALLIGALAGATLRPYLTLARHVYAALYAAAGYTLRLSRGLFQFSR